MAKTSRRSRASKDVDQGAGRPVGEGMALLADWNSSLAEFYFRRVQLYWLYPLDLVQLGSFDEVARSLKEFEAQLITDYEDQAEELARIVRREPRKLNIPAIRDYETSILKAQEDAAAIIDQAKVQAERIIDSARAQVEAAMPRKEQEAAAETPRKSASA